MTKETKGAILALTGSVLWGVMGVVCQYLLQKLSVSAIWLVNMRMFFAGMLLLVIDYIVYGRKKDFFAVWKGRYNQIQMLVFSFITVMSVQFFYLSAVNYMNVAMATVFVSLAPIATILWVSFRAQKLPNLNEAICCIVAVVGAIIMATHGDMTTLAISEIGLFFGAILPISGLIYTVQPAYLMKNYRPSNVVGWGLLLGGIVLLPFVKPWILPMGMDMMAWLAVVYTIVFGTAVAFWTFLASLQYIQPHIAAIYELIEPVSAIILSMCFLDVVFEKPEFLGTTLIMLPVIYLTLQSGKNKQ